MPDVTQPGYFNIQQFTDLGALMAAGRLYTYAAGTTTFKAAYTESTGMTQHTYTPDGTGLPDGQYIALNARGELPAPLYLLDDGPYDITLKTAAGATVWTRRSASVRSLFSGQNGAASIGFIADIPGAVERDIQEKARDWVSVEDVGIAPDGTTDRTTALIALANDVNKLQIIPPGTKFVRKTLIDGMPTDVVFLDLSTINDFTSAGETTKHIGIVSGDEATNDTHFSIDSGHHAVLALNNFGTSGSVSGDERKGSIVWNCGQYALGSADKRGFRIGALLQFTKDTGATYWMLQLRSQAPWESLAGEYEIWAQAQTISGADVYRVHGDNHYKSTGAGTTGATPPTHTSGTVSDGGVSWTWLDYSDRGIFICDQHGRWLIGTGALGATFTHRVSFTDPEGSYIFQGISRGVTKSANLKLIPTNGSSVETAVPYLRATAAEGLLVLKSDGASSFVSFNDTQGLVINKTAASFTENSSGSVTPDLSSKSTWYFTAASPVSITGFPNLPDGHLLECYFLNSNITLVHSGTLRLAGSVNVNPTLGSVITLRKIPTSISDAVWEVSRSIK